MTTTMHTTKAAIPLGVARAVADRFISEIASACVRVEVAGSIRRSKPTVGDIEIVAIPRTISTPALQQIGLFDTTARTVPSSARNRLDERLAQMIADGMLDRTPLLPGLVRAWGPRYKKAWLHINDDHGWAQLDLFIATPENWGAIYAIRTGSANFSRALVTYAKVLTPYRQSDGSLIISRTNTPVSTPSERAYFATLGVPWLAPEKRGDEAAQRLFARIGQGRRCGVMDDGAARAFIRARLERGIQEL